MTHKIDWGNAPRVFVSKKARAGNEEAIAEMRRRFDVAQAGREYKTHRNKIFAPKKNPKFAYASVI